uniref:Aminoacyl-tRNA synthetase class II (D/K/N) domain-containing protein n=1 Tax=Oncorhynchus tshawytscha TaxID=74940 RepID=A0A8C8LNK2_ONCTS
IRVKGTKKPTGEVEVLAESVEILNVCHKLPCEIKDFVKVSRLYDYAYIIVEVRKVYFQYRGRQTTDVNVLSGKYFQLAQCYRDEGSKPDRQPEFTQLIEGLVQNAWPVEKGYFSTPLPCMMYEEAMKDYGGDIETFPNTEIEFLKEALNQPGTVEDQCILKINIYFFHDDCSFESPDFHYFLLQCPLLGKLRLQCAEPLEGSGMAVGNPSAFHFLWVVDFPLFLPKEDDPEQLDSAHHPFTEPLPEDTHLLHSQCEIGGGSILIHKASEQQHVLETILKDDPSLLSHLLEALDSGAPLHGGISEPSIRDVIAFPKSFRGHDLMSHAPDFVSENELKPYHISVNWPADGEGNQEKYTLLLHLCPKAETLTHIKGGFTLGRCGTTKYRDLYM